MVGPWSRRPVVLASKSLHLRPATCGMRPEGHFRAGTQNWRIPRYLTAGDAAFWRCEMYMYVGACVRLLYLELSYYLYPAVPPGAPFAGATLLFLTLDSLSHERPDSPVSRFELVRLGKSGCVQVPSSPSPSSLSQQFWVVPDGNLPSEKTGSGPSSCKAKRLAEPRILRLVQIPNTNGAFFSRKHAFNSNFTTDSLDACPRNRTVCDL
jgi:hypothetical protein